MPFFVAKGTKGQVMTPSGRIVNPYVCRRDSTFTNEEMEGHGLHLYFRRGGFTLIVQRRDAQPVEAPVEK